MLSDYLRRQAKAFPNTAQALCVLLPGLPVLAAFLLYLPYDIGSRVPHVSLFLTHWALDTCLLVWLITWVFRAKGYLGASLLAGLLSVSLGVCALAFQEVFRPSLLLAHYSNSLGLPVNTVVPYLPFALLPLIMAVCFLLTLLPRWPRAFDWKVLGCVVGLKGLVVLAVLLFAPAIHEAAASQASLIRRFGLLGYYLQDARHFIMTEAQPDVLARCQDNLRANPLPDLSSPVRSRKIMVIQFESLDLGTMLQLREGREITPFLNHLARTVGYHPLETNHNAISGSIGTDFQFLTGYRMTGNHASFWYDLTPLAHSSIVGYCADLQVPFEMFHGNSPEYYRRNLALRELGLKTWYSAANVPKHTASRWGVSDQDMANFILGKVGKEQPQQLLGYWITLSSHVPFDLVDHQAFAGKSMDARVANAFNYTDGQIRRLIEAWPLPDTLFLLYGDHPAPLPGHHNQVVPVLFFRKTASGLESIKVVPPSHHLIEVANLHNFIKETLSQ